MNRVTIVPIGDEILIGQIMETNSTFLSKELDEMGFRVDRIIAISDTSEAIREVMEAELGRANLVVLTGGLGPTKDDVTKQTFCEFFSDHLIEDKEVLGHVTRLLESYYKKPISETNKKQALVPSKALVLKNRVGTAPGMLMKKEGTVFVSLPGVPFEMKTIFTEQLRPYIQAHFQAEHNVHRTIMTYGIGESLLAEYIAEWEEALPKGVSLAYLPSFGRVRLRLTTRGKDRKQLETVLQRCIDEFPESARLYVTAYEDVGIEVSVGELLKKSGKSISFAESCTGGGLAQRLASIPGASAYLKGGVVTYATHSKTKVLGVSEDLIDRYSVVSGQVAKSMAVCAKALFQSDYAVATTGNAGPSKGDSDAEVGTVYIGIATPEGSYAREFHFLPPREKVVQDSISKGLQLICKELMKK